MLLVDLAIDRRKPTAVLELGGDLVAMKGPDGFLFFS